MEEANISKIPDHSLPLTVSVQSPIKRPPLIKHPVIEVPKLLSVKYLNQPPLLSKHNQLLVYIYVVVKNNFNLV